MQGGLLVIVLAWVMRGQGQAPCGGTTSAPQGMLHTPHFPNKFLVPIRCRWVIDASQQGGNGAIVVYFTQLFVSGGLSFMEFDYYEHGSTFQLGGREIHRVTEQNLTSVSQLVTRRPYLVVNFILDHLEGNHLRVLDGLLDVYGFNLTYVITNSSEALSSCSVVNCSMSGHCYVSQDFRDFWCACFAGFSGSDCSLGPLCQPTSNLCENGATCRQVGATFSSCLCAEGFTGAKCDSRLADHDCTGERCTLQCPEDVSTGEPCNCGSRGTPIVHDRARYEGTLRLSNVSATRICMESSDDCSLKPALTKQISKYLRSSNLTMLEDLQVLDVGFSGDVRFHFWGGRSEGSIVRESLNRLVQRGRLGNASLEATHLAITQEPTLHLQSLSVNHPKQQVREGDQFILSCVAQGSSHLMFQWFKDGVFVNVSKSRREMWVRTLPLDSAEQYTSLLGVEKADALDHGVYTCQVSDWGYQQCRTMSLNVLLAPLVKVDPMSVTVEKGENLTIKCTSPTEYQFASRFGYSWTKNNALFKMIPGEEYWEDLYPGGSLLRIYDAQKSATYTCHVHGGAHPVWRSSRLEVLSPPWCPTDEAGVGGVRWDRAGPGVVAKVECPGHYTGVATRLCLLVEHSNVRWQTPDFSGCTSDKITTISNNFLKLTLGFGNTSATDAVFGMLSSLRDRGVIYPGEGEPAITLLHRVTSYVNETCAWNELGNSTNHFYSTINTLLQHRNSIINHQKVEELQHVVNLWSGLWGAQGGTGSGHLTFDSLVVDLFRFQDPSFRHGHTLKIPRSSLSYPTWFSSRIVLRVDNSKFYQNSTSSIAVIVYHKLSDFMSQRFSQTLPDGGEVQFEVASSLVSVVTRGSLRVLPSVELAWAARPGWELRCGVTVSPSSPWNLTACQTTILSANYTLCHCPQVGTYAAMIVKVIHARDQMPRHAVPQIVLVGCACCLVQSLLTLAILVVRWWRHRTCLVFLKLQCSVSTVAAMLVFLYACSRPLPETLYPTISTSLQAVVLISMSCHLSKVLLVYTEMVHLPDVKYLKQTIIAIISGVPLLVVLCNRFAQVSMDARVVSWWLDRRTMVFSTCIACGVLLIVLFIFLHIHVSKRLNTLATSKNADTKKAVHRRLGLLNRAGVVFSGTVLMAGSSVLYINYPTVRYQYLFSLSSALLGFLLLACYVLHCESALHLHVLRTLKLQQSDNHTFSSESDSTPLSIFTKQEPEVECEGVPPRAADDGRSPRNGSPKESGSPRLFENTTNKDKSSFKNELFTVSEKVSRDETQLQECVGSPHVMLRQSPADPSTTTRVCVITSVVVDTPSIVVCSVDVEPCKTVVSCSKPLPVKVTEEELSSKKQDEEEIEEASSENDADVMDRICHDLNYLLNGVKDSSDEAEIPSILIHNTSL